MSLSNTALDWVLGYMFKCVSFGRKNVVPCIWGHLLSVHVHAYVLKPLSSSRLILTIVILLSLDK